jgi:hypothetical protein
MRTRSYFHYSDQDLMCRLKVLVANERSATAELVACIAVVEKRGLFRPAGYDSMHAYCLHELHLSDDAAFKRIRAARAALDYPAILDALADGRLHLTAVVLLAKHLRPENAAELLQAAEFKTTFEVKMLIAERFPQVDLPARIEALPSGRVSSCQTLLVSKPVDVTMGEHASPCSVAQVAPVPAGAPRPRLEPLSAESFEMHASISRSVYEKIAYAQALLGHSVPTTELPASIERAYDALIAQLEKQKFAKTSRQGTLRSSVDPRHIPAHVKRAVLERDGGRCTFVGESGHRCGAVARVEFDHIDPVAVGGEATVDNIRLRCRAHNQYEAERIFGAGFMETKRDAARQAATEKRGRTAAEKQARAEEKRAQLAEKRARAEEKRAQEAEERDPDRSVVPWLRQLGCGLEDAREAAAYCATMPPEATMEERIRAALRFLSRGRGRAEKRVGTAA